MSNKNSKSTLHLVSHTHWDREWYLPFQLFRLKLVSLIDNLLYLLEADPEYGHFLLDGQTIILDDYLEIRPEMEATIRKYVQDGRLLIGPWYILPDEFLVSPEATIRNLLQGERTCLRFGSRMNIGYLPDPFGHIGQMPQILLGFGIDSACLQRGLADEPCEFWWRAPDGSKVLVAYLRDGYMNAARLPTAQPDLFVHEIGRLRDSLLPHTSTDHVLLMQGNDHTPPDAETSRALDYAQEHLHEDTILHSSLPDYVQSLHAQCSGQQDSIPVITGELRSSKRHHLLPGVLSTRMWIKQRNNACETMLEKWAEPFSTWASMLKSRKAQSNQGSSSGETAFDFPAMDSLADPAAVLRQAWRLLMQCHPHDSICGCSIDQVHNEMRPRFDQVEQIAEEITRQSLSKLAAKINTNPTTDQKTDLNAIIVFNPTAVTATEPVLIEIELREDIHEFVIVDQSGTSVPYRPLGAGSRQLLNVNLDKDVVFTVLRMVQKGRVAGMAIQKVSFQKDDAQLTVNVVLSETGKPDIASWKRAQKQVKTYLADPEIEEFIISARTPVSARLQLLAHNVPPLGYQTFWVRERTKTSQDRPERVKTSWWIKTLLPIANSFSQLPILKDKLSAPAAPLNNDSQVSAEPPYIIQNEYFRVEASQKDGTLTVYDQRTGAVYPGLNRFIDGGDSGDEYNFNPPPVEEEITSQHVRSIRIHKNLVQQSLEISLSLRVPVGLTQDRQSRSAEIVDLIINVHVILARGVPRVDIHTEVDNGNPPISDHRLRVHFPAPFSTKDAHYDGHFEIVRRSTALAEYDSEWIEEPRPEKPQRLFTGIKHGDIGLALANKGLPEIEVFDNPKGNTEIALTLIRCVGWLSRDDLSTRKGHAGPMLATPEAQMPGKYSFDYAIIPHSGDWSQVFYQAQIFNSSLKAISTKLQSGYLPSNSTFLEVSSNYFAISTVKCSEDGAGWVVRGYNLISDRIDFQIKSIVPFSHAAIVNLAEEVQEKLPIKNDHCIDVSARGHEIITIKWW